MAARRRTIRFSRTREGARPGRPYMVAIDPRTGLYLRGATAAEIRAYERANRARKGVRAGRAFDRPVNVGGVLIDAYHGPGAWHGGAGF